MNREQAKARKELWFLVKHQQTKQYAFNLINEAEGHNGLEVHWDVFCHFADGGEVDASAFGTLWTRANTPDFHPDIHYRKTEKPFVLGGIELPERPQTKPLELGQKYYHLSPIGIPLDDIWDDSEYHLRRLKSRIVFLTFEGAEAFHKAKLAMVEQALKGEVDG